MKSVVEAAKTAYAINIRQEAAPESQISIQWKESK